MKFIDPHEGGVNELDSGQCKRNEVRDSHKKLENNAKLSENIISCFYANARSIVNKLDELALYVSEEKPDVIGITETWLHEDILNSEIGFKGYTVFRKDRISNIKIRGGGVMLYISNKFNAIEVEDLKEDNFPESLWCRLEFEKFKILLGICYRPPDSAKTNDDSLFNLITKACECSKDVIIMGDFNYPQLNWKDDSLLNISSPFVECLNDNFLTQMVNESTRGDNTLDLLITSNEDFIENVRIEEPFSTSDHKIVRWSIVIGRNNNKENDRKQFNYFKGNYDDAKEKIKDIDWQLRFNNLGIEEMWEEFKNEIFKLRDEFIPIMKSRNSKQKWVTKEVTKRRRAKEKAWKKYVKSGKSEVEYNNYLVKLHEANKTNKQAKVEFEKKLASNIKKDSKSFFAYVGSKQRTKDKVGPLLNEKGDIVSDHKEAADLLNKYFSSVFTAELDSNIPEPINLFNRDLLQDGLLQIDVSDETVKAKLGKLNVSKSPGLDDIHGKMLFELRECICRPLGLIYRATLERGEIPVDWKDAGVTPLFKKGKRSESQNYRPVSLTSIPCKVLESIIKDGVLAHLEKFDLIKDTQHGFLSGRSCLTNLLEYMEEVTEVLDKGNPVDVIYLDFAKAFDKVPHKRLFRKLTSHGISGNLSKWIENWLTGRRQKVCINGTYSEWQEVISGVPQGSVLGPLLFLIFINDIDEQVLSRLKKFADDTKLYREINSVKDSEILQDDIKRLVGWSEEWKMLFNIDKCSVMHLGRQNDQYRYSMGSVNIKSINEEKDLGVLFDSNIKFSSQCSVAVRNANRILGLIRRNILHKSKDVILRLYKSLVRPHLEYCIQVWSPYLRKDIVLLEKVQKRATKMISEISHLSYEQRLKKLGLISLEKRRIRGDLIQAFKIIKGFDKVDSTKFFTFSTLSSTRGHRFKLSKKRTRLELRRNFFSQRVVNTWNKLPNRVVDVVSVNAFKQALDEFDKYA